MFVLFVLSIVSVFVLRISLYSFPVAGPLAFPRLGLVGLEDSVGGWFPKNPAVEEHLEEHLVKEH